MQSIIRGPSKLLMVSAMDSIVATFLDVEAMTYVSASETAKYEQLFFGYIQRCEGEVSWRRYTL